MENCTLIAGYHFETEIFKDDQTFHFVSPCPMKALEFGFANKNNNQVYLYS